MLQDIIVVELLAGETLFNTGEEGIYFYILKTGELTVKVTEGGKKTLYKGDMFGEISLLQKKNRTGTVQAQINTTLFCLNGETFRKIQTDVNQTSLRDNLNLLHMIPIFSCLNNHQLHSIVNNMHLKKCNQDMTIIKEGDEGDRLFIIVKGTVVVSEGGKEIRKLGTNDFFGELSVLFSDKRTVSIVTESKCLLIEISTESLIDSLGENFKDILLFELTKRAFTEHSFCKVFLRNEYVQVIYQLCSERHHQDGTVVINGKNDKIESRIMIIVIEGSLMAVKNGVEQEVAGRGQVYCNFDHASAEMIVAKKSTKTLEISFGELLAKVGETNSEKFIIKLKIASQLKALDSFKEISDEKISKLVEQMEEEPIFKNGDVIFKEGEVGDKFYFILKGLVSVSLNGKFMRKIEENNFFGEMALILDPIRSATVVVDSDTVQMYSMSKEAFLSQVDNEQLLILKRRLCLQDTFSTKLKDFFFIKNLGEGKFGAVCLVHNKKNLYAIKSVPINAVRNQKMLAAYFVRERNILLSLDHKFMVKLVKTLRDDNYLFYLLEYVNGIVMSKYLESRSDNELRNKSQVQFFIAIILLVIDYLNSKKIAHRDLKPDNIMMDEKGYLKLIDFGTANVINDFTTTVTGTPHYIAPEVLQGRGYGLSVDYWSIGIIAFEIYFDSHPFGPRAKEPMEVYRETLKKEVPVEKHMDKTVLQFVKTMLRKKPKDRVCNLEEAKKLSLFNKFQWNMLLDYRITSPYIPKLVNEENLLGEVKVNFLDNLYKSSYNRKIEEKNKEKEDSDTEGYDPKWIENF